MSTREIGHTAHILTIKAHFVVFFSLLGLTALTTWISYFDLGAMNTVVAITIACAKMLLVVLYFMHLRHSERLIWIFAGSAVVWLFILFSITMSDYLTRVTFKGWT